MVRGEHIELCMQIHRGRIDPDSTARGVGNIHICMDLCDGNGKRGTTVHDCMFTKQNDLARCGRDSHINLNLAKV
jgi:hypothetical protein